MSLFLGFLVTPGILFFSDTGIDISYFYSLSEEENKDLCKIGDEKDRPLERNLLPEFASESSGKKFLPRFQDSFWDTLYLETISPPPELTIVNG